MKEPLINILTRTSNRPNYFARCQQSIREQDYKNVRHIVSIDNDESKSYVRGVDTIVRVHPMQYNDTIKILPRTRFAPYNLYLNDLLDNVEDG